MIGIKCIASYLPTEFIDNLEQGKSFAKSEEYIRTRIGAWKLPKKSEAEETSDLAVSAVRNLISKTSLSADEIELIALVTQNGDRYGLPHTSPIVQEKLGLDKNIATFDISLGCSGYVYGLAIVKGFLDASGLKNGILVTADPYSKIIDRTDRATTLLFGDAATATWVGQDAEWEIKAPLYLTDGAAGCNLHADNGILCMNGRKVYKFAVSNVPLHIRQILERECMDQEDIDAYCLHQGSAAIINAIANKFSNVKDKFIVSMGETGNTVSSSIPLLLEERIQRNDLNTILISGFGVGLSIATTIISNVSR
ncbi:3-oxoacyl-ACP synthase [Syntrophobacter sp. SbD1]|nr:3-oxoacyl-ACP synthase [Syntrophobacter sp. SbD1]